MELKLRDEFQNLSRGQQDFITQILKRLAESENKVLSSVATSETNITERLDIQHADLNQSLQTLSTSIPDSISKSETKGDAPLRCSGCSIQE